MRSGFGSEGVLEILPVGFDLFVGGFDFRFERVEIEAADFAGDLLAFESEVLGDDVAVDAEAGAEDGVDFFRGEHVGGQVAQIGFGHAEAADALFDEIAVGFLVELAILVGEGAQAADVGRDFLVARIDAEFLLGLAQDHAADEEFFGGVLLAGGAGREAHEELIEAEIPGAGETGDQLERVAAEALEFHIVVGSAGDLEDGSPARCWPGVIRLDADQDEARGNGNNGDRYDHFVFVDVFDHEIGDGCRVAGKRGVKRAMGRSSMVILAGMAGIVAEGGGNDRTDRAPAGNCGGNCRDFTTNPACP